jgi:acetylornithine deacetylase/succinyl-diaminopimelate desuccinylase-like protein
MFKSLAGILLTVSVQAVAAQPLRPDRAEFRSLYKELVETNTTQSAGSCTLAAERMAARLKAAGIPDAQIVPFAVPEKPKDGGLVVLYPGSSKALKPVLLLAHIDVVEAKRADWSLDPFTFTEKDGYFYGRGTSDDKTMAAVFVANLIRLKQEGYTPDRDLILALTADEEGGADKG